jgi:hypothetical protein
MRLRVFLCAASTLLALTVVAGWAALTPPLPSGGVLGSGSPLDPAPEATSAPPGPRPEPSVTVTHRERVVTVEAVPPTATLGNGTLGNSGTEEPADRAEAADRTVEPTRVRPPDAGSRPDDRRPVPVPEDRNPPRD